MTSSSADTENTHCADHAGATMLTAHAGCDDAVAVAASMWAALLIDHAILNEQ